MDKKLSKDIPYWVNPMSTIYINRDSQSTIGRVQNVMYNDKSRHIHRRHNIFRQLLSTNVIFVDYMKLKEYCGSAN